MTKSVKPVVIAGGPQGRRAVVLVTDHGAKRKLPAEEQADHGLPDRPELTGYSVRQPQGCPASAGR